MGFDIGKTDTVTGPFELTKLSAQISVLMADRNDGGGKNDAIRKSYQNLGTFKTAQNLIKHRGWRGLYSGFHLHLRKLTYWRNAYGEAN
jgi:solute carrier family 25 carnitine/acylcarnitine transporter 20/29